MMVAKPQSVQSGQQTAVLYARVSTGRQAENDLSIPDQFMRMRKYCEAQKIKIVDEYKDARSGRTMVRDEMIAMLERVRNSPQKIDYVIVYTFSRFSRDAIDAELLRRDLANHGTQLISITQPIGDDPSGDMLRMFINIFDEHNSRETSKHVSRSMQENARQGFWNGGKPPFGFRPIAVSMRGVSVKKKLEISPVESEYVLLIYKLYLEGDGKSGPLGIKKITTQLNADGHMRRGSKWTTGQVHRVLSERIYIGEREFRKGCDDDESIIVPVPPIVDAVIFDEVQLRLRQRNPRKTPPRASNTPILLTGIAACIHCGGGMILGTGKSGRYRYYTCSNRVRKGHAVCPGQRVPMPDLDAKVTEILRKGLLSKPRVRALLQELASKIAAQNLDEKSRMGDLRKELTSRQSGLTRLYDGVHKGIFDIDDPQFSIMLSKATTERDIVQRQYDDLGRRQQLQLKLADDKVHVFQKFLQRMLSEGPVSFRRSYLRAFISNVIVKENEVIVSFKSMDSKEKIDG